MLKMNNGSIVMTKGDTAIFNVIVLYPSLVKKEYVLQDGDVLIFTLKKQLKAISDEGFLIKKTFYNNQIKLNPSDTNSLDYGDYVYDVQLTFSNGDINTIIPPSRFTLCDEVT